MPAHTQLSILVPTQPRGYSPKVIGVCVCVCVCMKEREWERVREGCWTDHICLLSPGMAWGTGREKWKGNSTGKERKAKRGKGNKRQEKRGGERNGVRCWVNTGGRLSDFPLHSLFVHLQELHDSLPFYFSFILAFLFSMYVHIQPIIYVNPHKKNLCF